MSRSPETIAIIGMDLGINVFKRCEKIFPAKDKVINAGSVPNPKRIIKAAPSSGFPKATAPAAATYVSPHGKKPFATPLKNHRFLVERFRDRKDLRN